MATSESLKKAIRKYEKTHVTYFKLTMQNEFAEQFEEFMKGKWGETYSSKSDFIKKAMKKLMIEDGYPFQEK